MCLYDYKKFMIAPLNCPIARHSISMREAYDNAMAYNRLMRAKEEEVLLVQEMCAYISYFKENVLSTLMSQVQSKNLQCFSVCNIFLSTHLQVLMTS